MIKETEGVKFEIRPDSNDSVLVNRIVNENVYQVPLNMKHQVFIDVGAHIGTFSVLVGSRGGRGYAIEPYSQNFHLLEKNIRINNLQDKVKCLNVGIGLGGMRKLFLNSSRPDWSSLDLSINELNDKLYEEVQTVSLSSIFEKEKIKHCNFLKLDCEGAEQEIIEEIVAGLHFKIDLVVAEFHRANLQEKQIKKLQRFYSSVIKISGWELIFKK